MARSVCVCADNGLARPAGGGGCLLRPSGTGKKLMKKQAGRAFRERHPLPKRALMWALRQFPKRPKPPPDLMFTSGGLTKKAWIVISEETPLPADLHTAGDGPAKAPAPNYKPNQRGFRSDNPPAWRRDWRHFGGIFAAPGKKVNSDETVRRLGMLEEGGRRGATTNKTAWVMSVLTHSLVDQFYPLIESG